MFLEKGHSGKNDTGRWIALILIVVTAMYVTGIIPVEIVMFLKTYNNPDLTPDPENPWDLWSYDISSTAGLALTALPFVTGLVTLLFLMRPVHERPWISLFTGADHFRWRRFFWAMMIWSFLFIIQEAILIGFGILKIRVQYQFPDFINLIIVSVILYSIKAVFEELFFRGYLMQGLTKLFTNKWMIIVVTSSLFAIAGLFYPEVKAFGLNLNLFSYLIFGIFLAICTILNEGLEIALGIHIINNIFLTVFFTKQSDAVQTPALFNIVESNVVIEITGFILISIIFFLIARRKFSWPGWGYLFSKIENPGKGEESDCQGEYGLLFGSEEDEDFYK